MRRVHVWFYGDVQGVFFRQKTFDKANSLGLSGWIKNLRDGSVEAVFEGEEFDGVLEFCKTIGKVDKVKVEEEKPEGLKGFKIIM